jgi:hypothetical protein
VTLPAYDRIFVGKACLINLKPPCSAALCLARFDAFFWMRFFLKHNDFRAAALLQDAKLPWKVRGGAGPVLRNLARMRFG